MSNQLDEVLNPDGLEFDHMFSDPDVHPYDEIEWQTTTAEITNTDGKAIFRQEGVEFPSFWDPFPINVVASKYFYGDTESGNGSPKEGKREYSLRQLVDRVINTLAKDGIDKGLFKTRRDAVIWSREMKWLVVNQHGSFNSPVWFNVGLGQEYGVEQPDEDNWVFGSDLNEDGTLAGIKRVDPHERPQGSACFIIDVPDTIEGIWEVMTESARLFKYGSGVGADWSSLRSTKDSLSGGGTPSGPVSFMKVQDETGGTIKSGGKTRRAAIMQTLKCWHPDVEEFVGVKMAEEKKAHALIEQGYDGSFNGPAYGSVGFQNVNQSLRVTDEFMEKAVQNREAKTEGTQSQEADVDPFELVSPDTGEVLGTCDPDAIMRQVAEGTHFCGDPGLQYEDIIQTWHTVPEFAPINSSNPCSEFMHPDNTACNLASLNVLQFREEDEDGHVTVNKERLEQAARLFVTGQEIIVDLAGYPSADIAENSHRLRPLGLGFANIGALIMSLGHPYDSDEGRALAGSIMAIEHFAGYEQSARMARALRPFDAFQQNRSSMLEVMNMHLEAARIMRDDECDYVAANSDDGIVDDLWAYATRLGDKMVVAGEKYGYRNSQISVVAPTGTIGFMLGCDTTGIEPSIALVSYKLLAGDSDAMEKIVNQTVPAALRHLGYADKPWPSDYKGGNEDGTCLDAIVDYLDENDTIEGAPGLSDEHLPVFDCAFEAQNGTRSIHHNGHIDMMAAVQPFVSGAISKTVNVPNSASVEDIYDAYVRSWRRGLKAVAIYRDGSKRSQPLSTSEAPDEAVEKDDVFVLPMDQYQKHLLGEFEVFAPNDFDEDWANPSKATTIVQVNEALAEGDLTTEEIFDLLGREVAEEYFGVSRETTESSEPEGSGSQEPTRYRLPNDRPSINHKFRIGQHEGYLNVGFYPEGYGHGLDGQPGEVFITLSKQGSSLNGFADQFATALSIMLQYRIPLKRIVEKFSHVSFEPAGFTGNSEIRSAKSVVDYVARYLGRFTGEGSSPFTQGA